MLLDLEPHCFGLRSALGRRNDFGNLELVVHLFQYLGLVRGCVAQNQFIEAIHTLRLQIGLGKAAPLGSLPVLISQSRSLRWRWITWSEPFRQSGDTIRLQQSGRRNIHGMPGNQGRGVKDRQDEFGNQPTGIVQTYRRSISEMLPASRPATPRSITVVASGTTRRFANIATNGRWCS